jgi:hypothetical protein
LLTSRRLIRLSAGGRRDTRLRQAQGPGLVSSVLYVGGRGAYLGLNFGEWGGGLRRIDLGTGAVTVVERRATQAICSGPLNTDCDPVNAITASPWTPGCVAVAVGLVHLVPHGRLLEVCGDRVRRVYFRPVRDPLGGEVGRLNDGEPFTTEAFFGLARSGDGIWAVGIDGLYRLRRPGEAERMALPAFRTVDGFRVSFAIPGVALVLSGLNGRASMSGAVPLMAVK